MKYFELFYILKIIPTPKNRYKFYKAILLIYFYIK